MTLYFIAYSFLSILICFFISKLFDSFFLKSFFFSIFFMIFLSFWYRYPGSDEFSPILSIFLLEMTIIESNGIVRLIRPMIITLFISIIMIFLVKVLRSKK